MKKLFSRNLVIVSFLAIFLSVSVVYGLSMATSNFSLKHIIDDPSVFRKAGESKEEVELYFSEMRQKIQRLYTNKAGEKSASEVPDEVKSIVKVELVPYEEIYKNEPLLAESFTPEEKRLYMGKSELRITFDNGEVRGTGPYSRLPSRIEIKEVKVLGKTKKVLIVEE